MRGWLTASLVVCCGVVAGCIGVPQREVAPLRFERPFEVFSYSADPGFGYCVEEGELERLVLRWEGDRIRATVFLRSRVDEDAGMVEAPREPSHDLLLSAEKSRTLATRIQMVPVIDDADHGCAGGALALGETKVTEAVSGDGSVVRQLSFEDDVIESDHRCRIDRFHLDYEEINVGHCTALRHYTPEDAARLLDWLRAVVP